VYFASGRRPATSLSFRGLEPAESFAGFTDRPAYADARRIADRLMAAYIDEEVDQVEIFYNGYISPVTQEVRRETLLPLQQATVLEEESEDADEDEDRGERSSEHRALVEYEPDPEEILKRLVPDYVEISIYRALLESTASEHGARMTAMRNASDNAKELIQTLTLEMNRARQAEITQEILEVVAGAEGLSG
jgi:F-type H+-transporting ATPase subunit gamma